MTVGKKKRVTGEIQGGWGRGCLCVTIAPIWCPSRGLVGFRSVGADSSKSQMGIQ